MENLLPDPNFAHASDHSLPALAGSPHLKPALRFIWGLALGLAFLLLWLQPIYNVGANFFGVGTMGTIVYIIIPLFLFEGTAVSLMIGKGTPWFGRGLLIGCALYMVIEIAFWLALLRLLSNT